VFRALKYYGFVVVLLAAKASFGARFRLSDPYRYVVAIEIDAHGLPHDLWVAAFDFARKRHLGFVHATVEPR
jgi:hypothetical protein